MSLYLHFVFILLDSPTDYDQNFPNLPDDLISKEDLETTYVPESTSSFEPTQAILPDIAPTDLTILFTQDNTDLVYGHVSTISPQTELPPTDSLDNKPTDVDVAPSPSDPSDQPPTGTQMHGHIQTLIKSNLYNFDN